MSSKKFMIFFLTIFLTVMGSNECLALKRVVPEKTREAIIEKYLTKPELDILEGVWEFSNGRDLVEIALIKTPANSPYAKWDYNGLLLEPVWGKVGEVKVMFRKSTTPDKYMGGYVVQYSGPYGFGQQTLTTAVFGYSNDMLEGFIRGIGNVTLMRTAGSPKPIKN